MSLQIEYIFVYIGALFALSASLPKPPTSSFAREIMSHYSKPSREVRTVYSHNISMDDGIYKMDLMSWVHEHTVKVGNISDIDLKTIVNSLKQLTRPESSNYPRVKVYNYEFKNNDDDDDDKSSLRREVLVYTDPEEEKHWIVNIDDLDLRGNLIVFRMGDLGFGFSKDNTFAVLRKTMSKSDHFHYFHIAYLIPRKNGNGNKGLKDVEWDNIKPRDLLPIPLIYKEPEHVHDTHCDSRECGLTEIIFGTCPITRLSCNDVKDLTIYGREKERIDALIREQQPFILELARTTSMNKKYLKPGSMSPVKRSIQNFFENYPHYNYYKDIPASINHNSFKNNIATGSIPTKVVINSEQLASENEAPSLKTLNVQFAPRGKSRNIDERLAARSTTAQDIDLKEPDNTGAVFNMEKDAEKLPIGDDFSEAVDTNVKYKKDPDTIEITTSPRASQDAEIKTTSATTSTTTSPKTKQDAEIKTTTTSKTLQIEEIKTTTTSKTLQVEEIKTTTTPKTLQVEEIKITATPKTSSSNVETDGGSYFEAILERIKSSPPGKYTGNPIECVDCESIGTFFSEFEVSGLVAYVANNIVTSIFKNTSSSEVFSPEAQKVLEENKLVPYIGYGSCLYSIPDIIHFPKSTELDDIITYYADTLGVNCPTLKDCDSQRSKTKMRELLTSKHHLLEVWPDMTVRPNKSSLLAKSPILSTFEFNQFMVSIVYSMYTNEYHLQMLSKTEADIPNFVNENQSARMKFQTKLILRIIDELIKNFPQHLVKGARYLLQLLEDKYLALVAEHVAIGKYHFDGNNDEEKHFKDINKNDRLQTLALKDFIMNGIASVRKSGAGAISAFSTFYNNNQKRFARLLVEFGVDRRRVSSGGNRRRNAEAADYETELLHKVWTGPDAVGDRSDKGSKVAIEFDGA